MFGLSLTSTVRDLTSANNELLGINTKLHKTNQTLSADLMGVRAELKEAITQRDKAIADFTKAITAATHAEKRIGFVDTQLYNAGKTIAALLKVWRYRGDNPKMSPKDRQTVNKDLEIHMANLGREVPKRIPSYSEIPAEWLEEAKQANQPK